MKGRRSIDPKDQVSPYHLVQALRKNGEMSEIPALLKRLAMLCQDQTKEEREQYGYKQVKSEYAGKTSNRFARTARPKTSA